MKSVCLKCNRPLEAHPKITAELIEATKGATYEKPVQGWRSPLSPTLVGCWMYHEPMMSTGPITWATPYGTTEM